MLDLMILVHIVFWTQLRFGRAGVTLCMGYQITGTEPNLQRDTKMLLILPRHSCEF